MDRTLQHSVTLMAVCDAKKKLTFISVGFPGSAHDSRVYKDTDLYWKVSTSPRSVFPSPEFHMLGDSITRISYVGCLTGTQGI